MEFLILFQNLERTYTQYLLYWKTDIDCKLMTNTLHNVDLTITHFINVTIKVLYVINVRNVLIKIIF